MSGRSRRKKIQWGVACLLVLCIWGLSCTAEKQSPTSSLQEATGVINADDQDIQYIGRFNHANPKKAVFDWPGVSISARFEGTSCSIRLRDGYNLYAVTVDGKAPIVLVTDTATVYPIAQGLADTAAHTVLIQKRTEAFVGRGEFLGFILDRGRKLLAPDPRPDRRIEIIGNSITCGYGVEGTSSSCNFTKETEDASKSYAAIVAKRLNADYSLVAYSGRGVVRNYGDKNKTSPDPMPSLFDRTCCFDSTGKWDFTRWTPQAVIVNLGTNDFSTQPYPDKNVFQEACARLIRQMFNLYPGVKVFCVCGPMIGEPCLSYIRETVTQLRNDGGREVFFIEIKSGLMTAADWGCDWHPNVNGQRKIAGVIEPVIRSAMGW
jgi:lysophospholipase L1-like esterase